MLMPNFGGQTKSIMVFLKVAYGSNKNNMKWPSEDGEVGFSSSPAGIAFASFKSPSRFDGVVRSVS